MRYELRTQENEDNFDPEDIENVILQLFENCKCVRYTRCGTNGYINTDGVDLISPRVANTNSTRPKCKGGDFDGQYICCRLVGTEDIYPPNTASEEVPSLIPSDEVDAQKNCGMQKFNINNRILVGNDESIPLDGEFPWIAAIYKKQPSGGYKFYCTGALIYPGVILTSNHYFYRKSADQYKVIINGKTELSTISNNLMEERNVSEIIKHPEFKTGSLFNDAALLILNEPFPISHMSVINQICLPPDEVNLEGVNCWLASWKQTLEELENQVLVMKKVELPFINFESCQDKLRKTRLGSRFNLHKSFMCAGGEEGKDACKGDGGSPLMCPKPGTDSFYIAGIVSWGIGCGTANIPGVYTNVQQVKGWILKELLQRQIPIDID